jgi:hypothetical protein
VRMRCQQDTRKDAAVGLSKERKERKEKMSDMGDFGMHDAKEECARGWVFEEFLHGGTTGFAGSRLLKHGYYVLKPTWRSLHVISSQNAVHTVYN